MNNNTTSASCKTRDLLRNGVRDALHRAKRQKTIGLVAAGLAGLAVMPAGAGPFPAEVELSALRLANGGDGSAGMVLNGIDIVDSAGNALGAAGDVNGDGIGDVIVGAKSADPDGRIEAGETYVIFGTNQGLPPEFEISSLLIANGGDGSAGFVLKGVDTLDNAGWAVAGAGDLNGDGVDDIVIGAPDADPPNMVRGPGMKGGGPLPIRPNAGEVYVVFGRSVGFAAEIELSSLLAANGGDGSAGFMLKGLRNDGALGRAVSAAGDINGDGVDDLLVGAEFADASASLSRAGETYLIFGNALGFQPEIDLAELFAANGGDGSAGVVLAGISANDRSGGAVSKAGDVNGDGVDDMVIGAKGAAPGGRYSAGQAYVYFGTSEGMPAEFELSSLLAANGGDGSAGFVLHGIDNSDEAGVSVSAGDINDDGFGDVIIGASCADPGDRNNAGETYVVFGTDQGFSAEIELSTLLSLNGGNGSAGFVLNGIDEEDLSGESVSTAGDINGDGIDDIIIGANYAGPGGREYAGESYLLFGTDQGFAAELELSALTVAGGGDGSAGFVLNGVEADDYSGLPVNAAGDVNGDGIADLLIAAQQSDPGGRIRAGQSYLVLGAGVDTDADGILDTADNCTLIANPDQCDTNGDNFGNLCDPDLNNDNVVNMLDLASLKAAFFSSPGSLDWNADADANCNNVVNFADLATMKAMFFGPPGPSGTAP